MLRQCLTITTTIKPVNRPCETERAPGLSGAPFLRPNPDSTKKKGEAILLPPSGAAGLFDVNQFTLIAICRGLASSALGTCTSSMPSRYVALISLLLTVCGR